MEDGRRSRPHKYPILTSDTDEKKQSTAMTFASTTCNGVDDGDRDEDDEHFSSRKSQLLFKQGKLCKSKHSPLVT